MSFFEFDCSDRTFEEIQIFAGFQDSNLDMLSKCFKSVCMIRDQKIKVELNETLSAHKVEEVIEACFSIIDTQHRLNSQDVSYICSLAFKNRLKDFKAHQLQAVCKTKTGKMIYPKTIGQAILCDAMRHNEIVFATGVAGTGKTYLAVAYAVSMLKSERVEKIILTRPAVEAGESLGFLPGDMKEKVDPYLRPLYDALNEGTSGVHNERRPVSSELLYDEVYRPPFYIYTGVVLKDKNGEELWNWGDKAPFEIYLPNTTEGEQGAVPHLTFMSRYILVVTVEMKVENNGRENTIVSSHTFVPRFRWDYYNSGDWYYNVYPFVPIEN